MNTIEHFSFAVLPVRRYFWRINGKRRKKTSLRPSRLCGEPIQWLLNLIQGLENLFRCERPASDPYTDSVVDRDGNHRSGTVCADFSD